MRYVTQRSLLRSAVLSVATLSLATGCTTTETAKRPDKKPTKPAVKPIPVLLGDANKAMEARQYDAALKVFDKVLKREPENADAKRGAAFAAFKLRQYERAKTALEALNAASPGDGEVMMALATSYQELGDFESGLKVYQSVLEKDPHNQPALLNVIALQRRAGNHDAAVEACKQVLARSPGNVDALKSLALIYFDQGKYNLSETIAITALKTKKNDASLYNARGMIRIKRGRYPEAIPFLRKAVELDSSLLSAHLNIASISLRYRDYATASTHYEAALKAEPTHAIANLGYGYALSGQQKSEEAVAQLKRAYELDNKAVDALGEIMVIYRLQVQDLKVAQEWAGKYVAAKGGKLADNDPMKVHVDSINIELEALEAGRKAAEEAEAEEAAEKAAAEKAAAEGKGES